jgi:hypothetical protein
VFYDQRKKGEKEGVKAERDFVKNGKFSKPFYIYSR